MFGGIKTELVPFNKCRYIIHVEIIKTINMKSNVNVVLDTGNVLQ